MSSAEVIREPCTECDGSGVRETKGDRLESGAYAPCPTCRGYGYVTDDDPEHERAVRRSILTLVLIAVIIAAFVLVALT